MTDQKTYLGDRTKYFGASDMPAMRGHSSFTSREMLIAKKRGDLKSFIEDTHYIDRGNEYEDVVYAEILEGWEGKAIECASQKVFSSNLIDSTCHLDGYFVEQQGNKFIVHIYEIKSKTVDTKTDFQDLADGFKANPPVEYLDQMELQYMLAKVGLKETQPHTEIEFRMHLVIGLFRGRSKKCTGTIDIDVTDIITSINIMSLSAEILNFWEEVENHNGEYSAETMLEIEKANAKLAFLEKESKKEYVEVTLDRTAKEHIKYLTMCDDYNTVCAKVTTLDKELKEAKDTKKQLEADILKGCKTTSKIDCGDYFIEVKRSVDNGKFTKPKEASYTSPKENTTLKITRLGE